MANKTNIKPPWQVKVQTKNTSSFQVQLANKPKIQVKVKKQCSSNNNNLELPTLNELMIIYTMGKL